MPFSKDENIGLGKPTFENSIESVHARWEASMFDRLDLLRADLHQKDLMDVAARCGAEVVDRGLRLHYWGSLVLVTWPDLEGYDLRQERACSLFDTMMLLYYLQSADGASLADRWISFRELPGGGFYYQAFQGYGGDRLARLFDSSPDTFHRAADQLNGVRLTGLSEFAYAFHPLPRIRMAALYWPGDEEFSSRGSILFDAASPHYMVLDGLAILGARLVSKLEKAREN